MGESLGRVLVIVPAWNEEANVGATIREIRSESDQHDIIGVDDGSTDRKVERAREAGSAILELRFNMGVGGAMRTGFTYAARHGHDRAIQVNADGQHDPFDIEKVLLGLEAANTSIGARFAEVGQDEGRGPESGRCCSSQIQSPALLKRA